MIGIFPIAANALRVAQLDRDDKSTGVSAEIRATGENIEVIAAKGLNVYLQVETGTIIVTRRIMKSNDMFNYKSLI
jgi:hypothetical protein